MEPIQESELYVTGSGEGGEGTTEEESRTFMQHDFGLDRRLIKAVAKLGFVYPTLVQDKCIPLALKGKDLLVRARTGSGKTAAFALPLLQKILRRKEAEPGLMRGVRAVVLVPTRELCEQARLHLLQLMHYCRDCVSVLALVDDNMSAQQAALRDRPDILVATPARLVAHLEADNVELEDTVETLVVDEADLVLSFGYSNDIRAITARLPKICQGFLMSATLSPELEDLKRVVLHSPAVLKLEEGARDGRLAQFYLPVQDKDDKFLVVFAFIKLGLFEGKGLFFVNQTDSSYRLKLFLEQFGVRSAVLNAELPLNSRLHILQEFNRGIFDYLIVTDDSLDVGTRSRKRALGDGKGEGNSGPSMGGKLVVSGDADAGEADEDGEGGERHDENSPSDKAGDEGAGEQSGDEDKENQDEGQAKMDAKKRIPEQEAGPENMDEDDGGEESDDEEEDEDEDEDEALRSSSVSSNFKTGVNGGSEFGVARGVDFREVAFVLNVDFPPTASSYTHRVGRTARAGASGTALSLVLLKDEAERRMLQDVQASQPGLVAPSLDDGSVPRVKPERESIVASMGAQGAGEHAGVGGGNMMNAAVTPQPAPLAFDIREIERFRYRVEDTLKKVTRVRVREARAAELKAEMLNSEKLAGYFEEHAGDLRVLRHDKSVLHPLQKLEHLKHIPDYLMPVGMQTGEDPSQRQRKRLKRLRGGVKRRTGYGQDQARRKNNDPLQTFGPPGAGDRKIDGGGDAREETPEERAKRMNEERKSRVFQKGSHTGVSTAGRRRWQERRKVGKHGGKERKPKKTAARFDLPV